ncbi:MULTISPECIES: hypothetical protein [Lonsdalea]|uniref:hypothetical protein n=1 Tax=Lonsdalea TaxID=1082702 RepID=UPI001301C247|nr:MULTISPECIES: hypothetical protein [Lonsdalea]
MAVSSTVSVNELSKASAGQRSSLVAVRLRLSDGDDIALSDSVVVARRLALIQQLMP